MGLNRLSWLMVQKVIELLAFLEKYVNIKPSQVSAAEKISITVVYWFYS